MSESNSDKDEWEDGALKNYEQMIGKIPIFLRPMAKDRVGKKAQLNARENNRSVNEKDMVDAFFSETPFGFHGPMTLDMEEFGIDYKKYGYPK